MSLVVFTGLCGLLVAPGADPSGARLHRDPVHRARRRRGGGAQPVVRGRSRRADEAHRQPAAAGRADGPPDRAPFRRRPRRLLGAADGARGQLARGRDPGRLDPVLRARLHRLAEAADAAEHRHRRRRRRLSAADRLGGGDRRRRAAAAASCSRIIFLWTPPHFWALSLFVRSDYAAAGVPMLPVVAGRRSDPAPDLALHPADGRGGGRALAARPGRARSTASPRAA